MSQDPLPGLELRAATADEMPALIATTERAFGGDTRPEAVERDIAALDPARTLAVFDGDKLVATAGIYTFDMTVPGGPIPVAGVTMVGVLPTHRRRGILSAMMRRQLDDLRESGEPVAALWASEPRIYRRFGYGLGSLRVHVSVESQLPYVAGAPGGQPVQLADAQASRAAVAEIYERARGTRPGLLSRSAPRWDGLFEDTEHARDGASSLTCALLDSEAGYVLYRTKGKWDDWLPNGTVIVRELMATDGRALAALWRYLLDMDLMRSVEAWNRPVDDPLLHLVADSRRARPRLQDGLWIRIVDVERALAARSYAESASLVVEVRDEVCPWNAGSFALDAEGAPGLSVQRTQKSADITLSAVELGSVYLGGVRLRSLAAAGLVDEHTPGAVTRADRLFAGSVEPWCAEVF